jgi:1-phosphatidylinositol-3-phosphate 5-kinase
VKDTGLLGAGKGEPTIITPRQYRQRFLSAMERYFPMVRHSVALLAIRRALLIASQVPDRWMKQRDVPEDDSNGVDGWAE